MTTTPTPRFVKEAYEEAHPVVEHIDTPTPREVVARAIDRYRNPYAKASETRYLMQDGMAAMALAALADAGYAVVRDTHHDALHALVLCLNRQIGELRREVGLNHDSVLVPTFLVQRLAAADAPRDA